jgi:hypothetical protein
MPETDAQGLCGHRELDAPVHRYTMSQYVIKVEV